MMPMFSGHFVATTNITTRMTSGMIWVAVMVGSDSEAAAGLKRTPPNTRAARPMIVIAATDISRIRRRRSGRPEGSTRVLLRAVGSAVFSVVLVMMLSPHRVALASEASTALPRASGRWMVVEAMVRAVRSTPTSSDPSRSSLQVSMTPAGVRSRSVG